MKKVIYAILFLGIVLFIINNLPNRETVNDLRIRVVANSNSQEDQELKQSIQKTIIKYLENNKWQKSEIENLLKNYNINYSIEQRMENFPAKVIKNKIIPSGCYETIVITLGSGEGSNWWSLLYPEFFGLTYDDFKEIEYHSYFYDKFNGQK